MYHLQHRRGNLGVGGDQTARHQLRPLPLLHSLSAARVDDGELILSGYNSSLMIRKLPDSPLQSPTFRWSLHRSLSSMDNS